MSNQICTCISKVHSNNSGHAFGTARDCNNQRIISLSTTSSSSLIGNVFLLLRHAAGKLLRSHDLEEVPEVHAKSFKQSLSMAGAGPLSGAMLSTPFHF